MESPSRSGLVVVAVAVAWWAVASAMLACSSEAHSTSDASVDGNGDARQDVVKARDGPLDAVKDARDSGTGAEGGTPLLTELSVSASAAMDASGLDGSAPIGLVPAFSSSVHDYYVRCSSGANALTVKMTASTGARSLLLQPMVSPSRPTQTVSLSVRESQAVVAAATDGTTTTEYWVRCLPHDFPQLRMTLHAEAGTPRPGYYLVGNAWLLNATDSGYAMVLNGDGVPVWYYRNPGVGVFDVDDVVPGTVTFRATITPTNFDVSEPFEIHGLSPKATFMVQPTGYPTDEHELRALPGGNFLILSHPAKAGVDLTGLSLPLPDGGAQPLGPSSLIEDCVMVEFEPSGSVVWSWSASDHFDPVQDTTLVGTGPGFGGGMGMPDAGVGYDVFHCNSVDVDPVNGNLLVSARYMDSIFYVERATGNVLWKMGGATPSKDHATYVAVADPFFEQHDARLLPGWSPDCNGGTGMISMFDDETPTTDPARGVVYEVVVGAGDAGCGDGGGFEGGVPGTATVRWQHRGLANSNAGGSFRISADGSRVIGWGFGGLPQRVFSEVDLLGRDLLDFAFTDSNTSYRAIKVPLAAFDLDAMRETAGLP